MADFEFDPGFPEDIPIKPKTKKKWWKTLLKILGCILIGVVITLVVLYFGLDWMMNSMWH